MNFGYCRDSKSYWVEMDVVATSTYMVRQVSVHDDHKISRAEVEAMDVCRSSTQCRVSIFG